VQLATSWGAKVIAAASSVEELNFLNDLRVTYVTHVWVILLGHQSIN
jgi:hypothetical protein